MNDDYRTIDEVLAGLPRTNPDAARSDRTRTKCHRTLARAAGITPPRRALESALVGGFCAVYFFGVAVSALHTHGLL